MSDAQTLDLTNVSVPDVEVVEDVPDNEVPVVSEVSEEASEEPVSSEAEVSEESAEVPVSSEAEVSEESAEEPVSSEAEEASEEPVVTTVEPVVSSPVPSAPVEQVVSDIREILADVPAPDVSEEATLEESSDSNVLTEDLKQRIAELDYLRGCCGNWIGSSIRRSNFITAWKNKNVTVDSNVNYEDVLYQLEKYPEIVKLWAEKKMTTESNYFKNIESYTLEKSIFNEKSITGKVEVIEQLVSLLTNSNRKIKNKELIDIINKFN